MARSTNQVVEVIPLMDGEDSPRRVLCPWRVHPLASTFPAVARATAGRLVRCEWLVGLAVCVLMGSASVFCVRCSPVRDSLEIGGPADSREPVAETPNDGRPAVSRAADTKTTGGTLWDTYDTAYQPLTSHEAAGRRSSNGRQGAGRRVHPPGTEHPPRAILVAHEVEHLDHLVRRSSQLAELILQLAKMVPLASFSTGLALGCADGLRPQGTQG